MKGSICRPAVTPFAAGRMARAWASGGRLGLCLLVGWTLASSLGCASLLRSSGPSNRDLQALAERNTRNLSHLQPDLFAEHVFSIMGPPQRVEGYPWGTVWLYRTRLTMGERTTPETDFTPLVFDRRRILLGWGQDFLVSHLARGP
jgi:hypothetical protein